MEDKRKTTVEAPLFVLFAEYLGYSSRFLADCESWCKGTIPPIYLQMAIIVEAKSILRAMLKDYGEEFISDSYDRLSNTVLNGYRKVLDSIMSEEEVMAINYNEL